MHITVCTTTRNSGQNKLIGTGMKRRHHNSALHWSWPIRSRSQVLTGLGGWCGCGYTRKVQPIRYPLISRSPDHLNHGTRTSSGIPSQTSYHVCFHGSQDMLYGGKHEASKTWTYARPFSPGCAKGDFSTYFAAAASALFWWLSPVGISTLVFSSLTDPKPTNLPTNLAT